MENKEKDPKTGVGPDPETLHTTDPQEHMKGPLSSTMNGIAHDVEEKGGNESAESGTGGQKMDGAPAE